MSIHEIPSGSADKVHEATSENTGGEGLSQCAVSLLKDFPKSSDHTVQNKDLPKIDLVDSSLHKSGD